MKSSPIISICIPCYGRVEYVRKTLQSIYFGNSDVSLDKYEVIISDNDPKQEVFQLVKEFPFENLKYYKTDCEGFLNSYYALTYGNGQFLKLHNSQALFCKNSLQLIMAEIIKLSKNETLIFYTNGLLGSFKSEYFTDFDSYMYSLSYWSSWSNGFGIWKNDFDQIKDTGLNKLFPHTSLFLTQNYKTNFCINDNYYFEVQRVKSRGDHNKFQAFTIEYPSLIYNSFSQDYISAKSKNKILMDLIRYFLPSLLFNKYIARIEHFDSTGFRTNLRFFFPRFSFFFIIVNILLTPFRLLFRRIKYILLTKWDS